MYKDLIFDLYGTLVDIHTEENDLVWEKTALYFGYYGAHYAPEELKAAFEEQIRLRQAKAGQSYECFPDIPFEEVMFRISSTEYIRLYPHVLEALAALREKGHRLWLLSNAQRVFTEYELRHLGLLDAFDAVYISSTFGYRKPDRRFFEALIREQGLDIENCLMIGNDRETDIAGAKGAGLATLYMHTGLTPPDQSPALPFTPGRHMEFEGDDWSALSQILLDL